MPSTRATEQSIVRAAPSLVYSILVDYRFLHPRILPSPYLTGLEVLRGGTGAGTKIRFQVRLMGITRTALAVVTEPEPGRVLVETDVNTGAATTFTVEPSSDDHTSRVTITTEWTTPGFQGWVERFLAPPMLRRIYRLELEKLEKLAQSEVVVQSR